MSRFNEEERERPMQGDKKASKLKNYIKKNARKRALVTILRET